MPTFDFQCQECQHVFEYMRPFGSAEVPSCPECRSTHVEKLIAAPTIVFKGEGFYKTDSLKAPINPKEPEKTEKPEPKTDEKSGKNEKPVAEKKDQKGTKNEV